MSYFTYFPKSDNPIKAVIRHLHLGTLMEDISKGFVELCFDIVNVKQMMLMRVIKEGELQGISWKRKWIIVFWLLQLQVERRRAVTSIYVPRLQPCQRWNATEEISGNILQGSNRKDVFLHLHCSWTILCSGTTQKTAHQLHEVWQTPLVMVDVLPPTQQHTLEYRTTKDSNVTEQCHQGHNCSAEDYERAQWGCIRRKQNCGTLTNTALMFKKQNVKQSS